MKNENSKALYRYWDQIRGDRAAPARTAIEPSEISDLLRDTFILQATDDDALFRLAGTRLCAAFGKELKGASFLDLWRERDRSQMEEIIEAVSLEGRGAVLGISANVSRDRDVVYELLLLPLTQSGPFFDRILGLMSPMQLPYWLGLEPLLGQEIMSARLIRPEEAARRTPRPPTAPGLVPTHLGAEQRRKRFVVLDGGKSVDQP